MDKRLFNIALVSIAIFVISYVVYRRIYEKNTENFVETDPNRIRFLNSLLQSPSSNSNNSSNNKDNIIYTEKTQSLQSSKQVAVDEHEEVLQNIQDHLELYISSYTKGSYNTDENKIINISPNKEQSQVISIQGKLLTRDFEFTDPPAWNDEKGAFLGRNTLVGPLSLNMGANGNAEFTMFLVCRHDEIDMSQNVVEMLKIYANTLNNNGIALQLYDLKDGIVPSSKIRIQFAGDYYEAADPILLDKTKVYIYIITKTPSVISLKILNTATDTIHEVVSSRITNPDCLFSNKAMRINRLKNWNAYFKAFGVYDVALSDVGVRILHEHIINEEKALDISTRRMKKQVMDLESAIDHLKKCPFDKDTCVECDTINDWSDATSLLLAPEGCKKAINTFCAKNPRHARCYCWDEKHELYNSDMCKNVRRFLTKDVVGELSSNELEDIKKKYELTDEKSCSKSAVQQQVFKEPEIKQPTPMDELKTVGIETPTSQQPKCPLKPVVPVKKVPTVPKPQRCKLTQDDKKLLADYDLDDYEQKKNKTFFQKLMSWF